MKLYSVRGRFDILESRDVVVDVGFPLVDTRKHIHYITHGVRDFKKILSRSWKLKLGGALQGPKARAF